MRLETLDVRKTHHGRFTLSTVMDRTGAHETRIFNNDTTSYQSQELPSALRKMIDDTQWHSMVADRAFVAYDGEAVETFDRNDALTVHSVLMGYITEYLIGSLN